MNGLVREFDRRLLRDHGVTFVQAVTLMSIASFEVAQPHLVAEALSQQSQTVTGVLDRLERAGHVTRLRDMGDRRAVRLQLSTKGESLAREVVASMDAYADQMFAPITAVDLQDLIRGLLSLEASLGAATPK
jgi:DNA-binding MarR family transcriptional regulator